MLQIIGIQVKQDLIMRLKLHYRVLVIVGLFFFSLYFIHRYISSWRIENTDFVPPTKSTFAGMHVPLLEYFKVKDGIDINWYHASSTEEVETQANQMVIATVESLQDLKTWLDTARKLNKVGLRIHFKTLHLIEPCLHHLYDVKNSINFPIIIHANVDLGSTDDSDPIREDTLNAQLYLFKLRTSFPNVRFSLGHKPTSLTDIVQRKFVSELHQHLKHFSQSVFITVCAAVVNESWRPLRWLLEQTDNLSLIITSKEELCSNIPEFDLLTVRNDWHTDRIFFDMPETDMTDFRSLSVTAGSPVHYFGVEDAARITWAHRVNRKQQLTDVLKGSVMFVEADLIQETKPDGKQVPIMAHPPEVTSDLTFQEWLDTLVPSGKGLKLDFKSIEVVEPVLKILHQKHQKTRIKQPVWLNADVLPGPNKDRGFLNATEFLKAVDTYFPAATVSIGFVTKWNSDGSGNVYTKQMIRDMHNVAKLVKQPITFPVRASMVTKSWEHFDWLLKQSRAYTLTIWTKLPLTDSETVTVKDMEDIRNMTEPSRVYFDLPTELMPV